MKASLRGELEAARIAFHLLLDSLSDQDLARSSQNPAWTNRQIIFHMVLGFCLLPSLSLIGLVFGRLSPTYSQIFAGLLNSLTRPFNVINAAGAYGGGLVFTRAGLGKTFDVVYALSLQIANHIPTKDWTHGMYYPADWDPLFSSYMTLEDIFRFPVRHFYSHVKQIAR